MKKAMGYVLLFLYLPLIVMALETYTFDSRGLKTLIVESEQGNIDILGRETLTAIVEMKAHTMDPNCEVYVNRVEDTLYAKLFREEYRRGVCRADFEIVVPRTVDVFVTNGMGDLNIRDTEGPLEITWGNGDIDVKAKVTRLRAILGNGEYDIKGLQGPGFLEIGNGDTHIQYSEVPTSGSFEVHSGNGDVRIKVPHGVSLNTDLEVGFGKVKNDFSPVMEEAFRVVVRSGYGNVILKQDEPLVPQPLGEGL